MTAYTEDTRLQQTAVECLKLAPWLLHGEWFVALRFPSHELTGINERVPPGRKKRHFCEALLLKCGTSRDLLLIILINGEMVVWVLSIHSNPAASLVMVTSSWKTSGATINAF